MFPRLRRVATLLAALAAAASLAGCSGSATPEAKPSPPTGKYSLDTAPPAPDSTVRPNPYEFGARIDNPWFPLWVGTRMRYLEHTPQGTRTALVTVTRRTRMITGVITTVVRSRTTSGGQAVQAGKAYYAQDIDGNVWLFGRDESGAPAASWMAGVDGAKPVIVMPSRPRKGSSYGGAEPAGWVPVTGRSTIVGVGASASVLAGHFRDLVVSTSGSTRSFYAKGVGLVLAESPQGRTELVKATLFD